MSSRLLKGLIGLWILGVAAGFLVLTAYQNGPGPSADAPTAWPAEASTLLAEDRPTLVGFAHPRCPCTEATMGEMARLVRHVQGQVDIHLFFVQPGGFSADWVQSALWNDAVAIPGVTPHRDPDGRIAQQFGALTSGQVLLYDADGHLLFNGGITGSRGHEGDNKGRQAVTEWITTGQSERTSTFVFGCLLMDPAHEADHAHEASPTHEEGSAYSVSPASAEHTSSLGADSGESKRTAEKRRTAGSGPARSFSETVPDPS